METDVENYATEYADVCVRRKKQRKQRQKLLVIDLLYDYAKNSTLHGLPYIVDRGIGIIERLFWIITTAVSVGLCVYCILNMFQKWRTSPVIVTVNGRLASAGTVPFPAVTICPQIKVKTRIYNYTDAYAKFKNNSLHGDDFVKFEHIDTMCEKEFESLTLGNRSLTNESLVRDITEVAPKIRDIFFFCDWFDNDMDCAKFFSRVYTADGVCYTSNSLAASEIFEDSIQTKYKYLDTNTASVGWSPETGYNFSVELPYPRRGRVLTSQPDMSLVLRHDPTFRDKSCNGLYSGYKIYLHHPADLPQSSLYYYAVLRNQVTALAVSFHEFDTENSLLQYSPDIRQCYFPSERKLRYFKIYTMKNCQAECLSHYTFSLCKCVGFYMPHDNSDQICAHKKETCMLSAKDLMAKNETSAEVGSDSGCKCLPACNTIEYDAETLKTEFKFGEKLKIAYPIFKLFPDYSYSRIDLYFKKSEFVTMQRREVFGLMDLLANIGGLLGLFLGFSFLSLVEIFYYLTLRVGFTLRRDLQEEKLQEKAKNSDIKIIMN